MKPERALEGQRWLCSEEAASSLSRKWPGVKGTGPVTETGDCEPRGTMPDFGEPERPVGVRFAGSPQRAGQGTPWRDGRGTGERVQERKPQLGGRARSAARRVLTPHTSRVSPSCGTRETPVPG